MKKIRKVNTKKRKRERKDAQERLAKQAASLLDHPTECCVCEAEFVRTQESVQQWHVVVQEERVRLTCPGCWDSINEVLENRR